MSGLRMIKSAQVTIMMSGSAADLTSIRATYLFSWAFVASAGGADLCGSNLEKE